MLTTSKSISLTGSSKINGTQVVYLTAKIVTNGDANGSITQNIMNEELYKANKVECRNDILEFQNEVYKIQDSLDEEDSTESTDTTAE